MTIEKLIKLTAEQQALAEQMKDLYVRMQEAKMAFAVNENGELAVYNSEHIADCEMPDVFGNILNGYEPVDIDAMTALFPVWNCETLCVKRK
jgi:hypothetical protein